MKKVIDYASREIIFYKFICNDPTIISTYVGHTINFTDRKGKHKRTCYNETSKNYNILLYKTIRENGDWDNWTMFEIERKIVASKQEALQNEQRLIDLQVEKLNMYNAVQNPNYYKNYSEQHKEQIIQSSKNYRVKNKIKISDWHKNHYEQNKQEIALRSKNDREQNKEKFSLRGKTYHNKHKEQINARHRELYHRKKELNLMSKEDKY
jgi:hypothetical protein